MDAFHERLAAVALRAGSGLGFALAGGYAVQAHGFLTRPSEDIDLFTSAERTDFRDGVNTIKSAYEKQGIIYPDAEFSGYGLQYGQIRQMRVRFADWRSELLQQPGPTGA